MHIKNWFKSIDVFLLLFLALFTVDMVILKPLIIVAGLLFIFKRNSLKDLRNAPLFYLFIPLLGLFNFIFINPDFSKPHLISFLIGFSYWFMSLLAFNVIKNRVDKNEAAVTANTLDAWFSVNLIWSLGNLLYVMIQSRSLNPYMSADEAFGNSTGDYIRGIILGPSYLNMFVNAFFAIYYLYKEKYKTALAATIVAIITTANFANFIFILILISCLFLLRKKNARQTILIQLGLYVFFYLIISHNNLAYITKTLNGKKNDAMETQALQAIKLPFTNKYPNAWFNKYGKAVSFMETGEYLSQSPKNLLFGAGIGEFSSQLAVRTSDIPGIKKSRLFSKIPVYVAPSFLINHYGIFAAIYSLPPGYHSIRHFPSSFANQLLGEYGLLGLILFLIFYLGYFLKNYRMLSFSLPLLLMLCYFLMFDYLFEYLSVVVFFELFFLLDRKQHNTHLITNNDGQ